MERRLAAILAADVVGYTGLMGADESGTLRRLTDLRENVLEPPISAHHGRIVKLMGDDKVGPLERLKELRKHLAQPSITQHKGHLCQVAAASGSRLSPKHRADPNVRD